VWSTGETATSETATADTSPGDTGEARQPTPDEARAVERCAEVEEHLRRALADLDNLRKRFDREVARQRAEERARVAREILPVVDNLELALLHAGSDASSLIEGVRAVHQQALAALARLGFPRFDDIGRPFDPARHEAVSAVEDEQGAGKVVAAVRPGYGTDETILRPAGVVVARRPG
jgi:molecular chaperone GrpE